MPTQIFWTDARREELAADVAAHGRGGAAAKWKITVNTIRQVFRDRGLPVPTRSASGAPPPALEIERPPSPDLPVEQLVERRIAEQEQLARHEKAQRLIPVKVRDRRGMPIGLLHLGDPHVDSPGGDLRKLRAHLELVRDTDGLWACNVGDTTDNWVGRLGRLWAEQGIKQSDSWRLAEWMFELPGRGKWVYIIRGNHDAWSGASDPLKWIASNASAFYAGRAAARIALRFPCGAEVRVQARHDFPGRSLYNPAHGPMRASLFGIRDHLLIAGHTHQSAYGIRKDPDTGILMHAVRVASYKVHDGHAVDLAMQDDHLSPAALTVIDPRLPNDHPDLIKVYWDPAYGADVLRFLRRQAGRKAA